jgi:hypothetical protein
MINYKYTATINGSDVLLSTEDWQHAERVLRGKYADELKSAGTIAITQSKWRLDGAETWWEPVKSWDVAA